MYKQQHSVLERLESRRHFSATLTTASLAGTDPALATATVQMSAKAVPTVNFVGQYETVAGQTLFDLSLIPVGTTLGSYNGQMIANGVATKFTAKESTSNVLSGTIGTRAFTATLSAKTLTLTYTKSNTKLVLAQVSTTPATTPPVLTKYTSALFDYVKPASWSESQSASGIVIHSPDGTQQVGLEGSVANGIYSLSSIASAEVKAGATVLFSKVLVNQSTLTTAHQVGVGMITFTHNGVTYASAQEIETYIYFNKGTYNAQKKTYSGVTLTEIYEASAPRTTWVGNNATLIYMMTSIKPGSSLTTGSTPKGSKPVAFSNTGLIDPGVAGPWSGNGLFNAYYVSNYYATAEGNLLMFETLEQQEAIDAQVNEFCKYLTS
jgi:hypothetical protein